MLSSIPLVNVIFNIEIFTYNFNWGFIKKSDFYFRKRERFNTNYFKIKNPIFNFSYWMHSNDLYSCLENCLIKKCCIISRKSIDEKSRSTFKPSYFLSLFKNPILEVDKLIFIFDNIEYQPKQQDRPLEEESFWDKIFEYEEDIFSPFLEFFRDNYKYNFILKNSNNTFLQFIALFINWTTNQYIETTEGLFTSCFSNPGNPLWKIFTYLFDYMKSLIEYIPDDYNMIKDFIKIFINNFGGTYKFWKTYFNELIERIYLDLEDNLNEIMFRKFQRKNNYKNILERYIKEIDSERIKNIFRETCL